jgi:hypothetical protein
MPRMLYRKRKIRFGRQNEVRRCISSNLLDGLENVVEVESVAFHNVMTSFSTWGRM